MVVAKRKSRDRKNFRTKIERRRVVLARGWEERTNVKKIDKRWDKG